MRLVVALVTVEAGRILLVKKDDFWILPGGKPEIDESDFDCLTRELAEELPMLSIGGVVYYQDFTGRAPRKADMIRVKAYYGVVQGQITPSREINDSRWASYVQAESMLLSDITREVMHRLRTDGYL